MSTDDMNDAIRTAAARGRFTVDETPADAASGVMNRAIRRQPDAEVELAEPDEPAFPDLGQGARGPIPSPGGPSMSDILRGERHARRQLVDEEIQAEYRFRTSGGYAS